MLKNIALRILQIIFIMICSFSYGQNSKLDSAYYHFKKGEKFDFENKHYKAYENYIKSLKLYKSLNIKDSIAKCNLLLFELIQSQNNLKSDPKPYLDNYYKFAQEKKDSLMLLISNNNYASYFWDSQATKKSRSFYDKSLLLTQKKGFQNYRVSIYSNLAYLYTDKYPDSAQFYFNKTLNQINKKNANQLLGTYINYALFFQKQKKFKNAIVQLKKAEKIKATAYQLKYNKVLFGKFANCYKAIGNYKKAYEYYEKYNIARDSLNNTNQNIAISDLDKKYKTAEKDKQILESETKRKENLYLLLAAIFVIFIGSIISLLTFKNSQRKRKLAEQQKELETQKNLSLLKEQEITTINAMVDGQEKERKRIAEDLHDNLGSVLATLKLHFENLKINRERKKINQDELFNKTETLIDEAYLKVRKIAHAKNAGVIANQGLLVAVQMMAEKISSADKIQIDVVDFGLDKPLENNLEITVFRVIQELITNIIKHSEATQATINLSLFEKNLNIIVEDNGKGMDTNNINLKDGMGISSIKTRIEHLKGTFNLDSTLGKGTSAIINVPIT